MSSIDSKRLQFEQRLEAIAGNRPQEAESNTGGDLGIGSSLTPGLLDYIREWEANLDHRLAEFHRAHEAGQLFPGQMGAQRAGEPFRSTRREAAVTSRELFAKPDASLVEWFQYTDTMMMTELEWGNHPLPAGFRGGYELLASDEAMQAAIAKACRLDKAPAGVRWKDYQLGVFHVPGRGTLINPSHYARLMGG